MITVIAEHSVDLSLLPEKANILDLGCRGFLFTDELERLGHNSYPVDCDELHGRVYYKYAITDFDGSCSVFETSDPQGTNIKKGNRNTSWHVEARTLKSFSENVKVKFWDLIKIDIEGSEYEVIMSLTEPPAKQLSIEFHLHTKIYGDAQVKEMEDKLLSLGYFPVKHDKTSQHGLGLNYWDSCWILKDTGGENV